MCLLLHCHCFSCPCNGHFQISRQSTLPIIAFLTLHCQGSRCFSRGSLSQVLHCVVPGAVVTQCRVTSAVVLGAVIPQCGVWSALSVVVPLKLMEIELFRCQNLFCILGIRISHLLGIPPDIWLESQLQRATAPCGAPEE